MDSKQQFRTLFADHEPELLGFVDELIEEFGRGPRQKLTVYCPVKLDITLPAPAKR